MERKGDGHDEAVFLVSKFQVQAVSSVPQQLILESAPHKLGLRWSPGQRNQPVAVSGRFPLHLHDRVWNSVNGVTCRN
jgi:hypothetical protein